MMQIVNDSNNIHHNIRLHPPAAAFSQSPQATAQQRHLIGATMNRKWEGPNSVLFLVSIWVYEVPMDICFSFCLEEEAGLLATSPTLVFRLASTRRGG